jgi:hypothetical protein
MLLADLDDSSEDNEREENQDKGNDDRLKEEKWNEKFSLQKREPFLSECVVCRFEFAGFKKIEEKRTIIIHWLYLKQVIFV